MHFYYHFQQDEELLLLGQTAKKQPTIPQLNFFFFEYKKIREGFLLVLLHHIINHPGR